MFCVQEKLHEWKISHMEHPTIDANSGVFQVASRDQGVFAYLMPDNYTLILTLSETVLPERVRHVSALFMVFVQC